MIERWQKAWQDLLRVILFFSILFTLFRLIFLWVYDAQWQGNWEEVGVALYQGFRLSLKTSGIFAGISFLFGGIPAIFLSRYSFINRLVDFWVALLLGASSLLFIGRIPYYQQFQSGYNYFIYQSGHEKISDLAISVGDGKTWTILIASTILVWCVGWGLWLGMKRVPYLPKIENLSIWKKILYQVGVAGLLVLIFLLCRYAGALKAANSLIWENVGGTSQEFLNEVSVDDWQALGRARLQNARFVAGTQWKLSPEEMRAFGNTLSGRPAQESSKFQWTDYIRKQAGGEKIPKPSHIFIILGESYGQWPLLPKYSNLRLAEGGKEIIGRNDSAWVYSFLPNGDFTHMAITALVTGLAEVGQDPNYKEETYKGAFETALAPQMAKLGYRSYFWYGGPGAWQQVNKYTMAQGFDKFYGNGELGIPLQNAWGIDDRQLFNGIIERTRDGLPSVNVIMTTSNHPPFSIDLVKEGFHKEEVRALLPQEFQKDEALLKRIGHYWYADREMMRFVEKMRAEHPGSLFIIMGDHSTRLEIEKNFTKFEEVSIPFIISGPGIKPQLFPAGTAGSQIQVLPTLIELIAPKGFEYYSLAPSLTMPSNQGVNFNWWITGDAFGSRNDPLQEVIPNGYNLGQRDAVWEKAVLAYSWWRIRNGNQFD